MQSRIKVIGEGGVHLHRLASPTETEKDGLHKHLFFVGDRLLMTNLSGEHLHMVNPSAQQVVLEETHNHTVSVQTENGPVHFKTEGNSGHTHEQQSEVTTLSGLHIHFLPIGAETYVSMLPSDLTQAIQNNVKSVPALKNFKLERDGDNPLEMDFPLVKRLNKSDFKEILQKSVFQALVKSFSRLKDGLQVESLVLSRERFFDLGAATRFVLEAGLAINGAEERPESYFFNVRAKERFDEPTLQRIRLTDGVEAVVGLLLETEVHNQDDSQVVSGDLAELSDRNKIDPEETTEEGTTDMNELQLRFASVMGLYDAEADAKVVKRSIWMNAIQKSDAALGDTSLCKFCGITHEKEAEFIGAGIRFSTCLVCALDRFDQGVFDACCDGTFDFEKYAELHPEDPGVVRYKEAMKQSQVDTQTKRTFEIFKRDEERRLIFGPVLIPENFDLQDDIISADEIESAAHNYMVKLSFREDPEFLTKLGLTSKSERGFMHTEFNRKIAVVESYIAPIDFEMNGRMIKQGTWVGVVKVFDDEVWNLVKAGRITGFSIGGRSRSVPAEG